jgi:predicted nucleic acid-binding protein
VTVIDASVASAAAISTDVFRERARRWLADALVAGDRLVAPSIMLAELAGAVRRATGDPEAARSAVRQYTDLGMIAYADVTTALAEEAAEIAAAFSIKGCDAVYVALARRLGQPLVTFDGEQLARGANVVEVIAPA